MRRLPSRVPVLTGLLVAGLLQAACLGNPGRELTRESRRNGVPDTTAAAPETYVRAQFRHDVASVERWLAGLPARSESSPAPSRSSVHDLAVAQIEADSSREVRPHAHASLALAAAHLEAADAYLSESPPPDPEAATHARLAVAAHLRTAADELEAAAGWLGGADTTGLGQALAGARATADRLEAWNGPTGTPPSDSIVNPSPALHRLDDVLRRLSAGARAPSAGSTG